MTFDLEAFALGFLIAAIVFIAGFWAGYRYRETPEERERRKWRKR